jgi:putative endopeptidase
VRGAFWAVNDLDHDAVVDKVAALDELASLPDVLVELHRSGVFAFFGADVTPDFDEPTRNLLWLAQSGLGLPDRDAYSLEGDAAASLRSAYVDHLAAQLRNVGIADTRAAVLARGVLELETRLAEVHLRKQDAIDPSKTLNRHDMAALDALAPELSLPSHLRAFGAGELDTVNVQNPRG